MTRRIAACLLALSAWTASIAGAAESLFVASVPGGFGSGTQAGGQLYSVELPGGATRPIGAIRVGPATPIAVTGLAVQPITGILYGITTDTSPNHPNSLVTIDPKTGEAHVVGRLGMAGSDITFDKHGMLYVWLRERSQLGFISLKTGEARPIGPGRSAGEPGGLAIDTGGRLYVAASGGNGSLDQVDSESGKERKGPGLHGAPYPAGINAISIAADGRILALNSNRGMPAKTALVGIDSNTGSVTRLGQLPDDADAIALVETPWSAAEFLGSRNGITLILAVVAIFAVAYVLRRGQRSRSGA